MAAKKFVADCVLPWVRGLTPYAAGLSGEDLKRRWGISECVKLASNENPLGPSPLALRALADRYSLVGRYPDGEGRLLKEALAGHLGVSSDEIILGNGSNEIIELVARAFLSVGLSAVVPQFAFVIFSSVVRATGAELKVAPARRLAHDLRAVLRTMEQNTRVALLANPNNPTGTIFTRGEWREFLADLPQGVVAVVDEAYAEFVEDHEYPDSMRERGAEAAVLTVRTFSKAYGLAGLRIGYGVGPSELVLALERVRQPFNVNTLAQAAAVAALKDREHVERTVENNREGMRYLYRELTRLGLRVEPSWANFLLFSVEGANQVYERLLSEGVIVRPLAAYGLEDYLRVSVGTPKENRFFIEKLEGVLRR